VPDFTQPLIEEREQWYCFVMPLFRSTISLFLLCRVKIAQSSRLHKRSRVRSTQFSTCCCAVWKSSVFLQVYFLMPDDRLGRKRKGGSKTRNAIRKTCYWLKILQASKMKTKNEKPVSVLLPVQSVSPQFVCIVVLQPEGEWMSFSTLLISRLTGA